MFNIPLSFYDKNICFQFDKSSIANNNEANDRWAENKTQVRNSKEIAQHEANDGRDSLNVTHGKIDEGRNEHESLGEDVDDGTNSSLISNSLLHTKKMNRRGKAFQSNTHKSGRNNVRKNRANNVVKIPAWM